MSLNDDQRKDLYLTLLRGIANECQDRLCAEDRCHAWSRWWNYIPEPDGPLIIEPYRPDAAPMVDKAIKVASRRHCLNCGKEQFA